MWRGAGTATGRDAWGGVLLESRNSVCGRAMCHPDKAGETRRTLPASALAGHSAAIASAIHMSLLSTELGSYIPYQGIGADQGKE